MVIKVGINGFGRIGRVIFRTCCQNQNIELSGINDPAIDAEYICYLIRFDSTHGKFNGIVIQCGDEIKVNDHPIKIFHEKLPSDIPWREAGVQYVIEASGMFTTLEKASGHLESDGVRRVLVTAPSIDVPMIILGVNDIKLSLDHKVLSCASSTLYCLAPIIKVLEDNFGVEEGFITSIHAMTPSLKPLDGLCLRGKHWRDHRSIHQNIIPASTGACKALGKIIPEVKDKISGLAFRIPIVNVSVLDLSIRLRTNTTLQNIVNCIKTASNGDMKNIIKISNEESVSSDFIGDNHSCILDVVSSLQLSPNFFKLICWYENEYSYSCRVVDCIYFSERQFCLICLSPTNNHINTKPCKKKDRGNQSVYQNKEIVMASCSNAGLKPEINVTSRMIGFCNKRQRRQVLLNKPSSSHNSGTASSYVNTRDTKKRNEIFKIWNDTNETEKPNVQQNRGSFFHSYISSPQQNVESTDSIKAQERLENVKREFSKMVHITENLLRKSYSNKAQLSSVVNHSIEDINQTNIERNTERPNTLIRNNNEKKKNLIFDVCGDYENKIETTTDKVMSVCSKEELTKTCNLYENSTSNCSISKIKRVVNIICTPIQSKIELNSKTNSSMNGDFCIKKSIHDANLNNDPEIFKHNSDFKEQVAKAINTLIDGLTQNFQIHTVLHEQGDTQNNTLDIDGNEIIKHHESDNDIVIIKSKAENFGDNSTYVDILDLEDNDKSKDVNVKHLHNELKQSCDITSSVATDKELKKSNNLFINNNKSTKSCSPGNENLVIQIDKHRKDMVLSKQILESLNKLVPEHVFIVPDDSKTNDTTINTMVNNSYVNQNKFNIYDKLDSASASGSENSFEIRGRKSQIIDINDITNSFEDLSRLEKICNIIEISDELSDKLFSTLEKKDCHEIKNKKWSFRDLCERIKLDEFCNKVFGKTVV